MTEKLKTLMDEVTAMVDADFAAPDLDAIVRDGDRALRRRRAAVALAGVAAAAVTVAGAVVLADGGGGGRGTEVADTTVDSDGMSWAMGSVLHTPGGSVDVGHPVRAYVRTTVGYVTVDDRGRVWSVIGDEVTEAGSMARSSLYLVSDTEDSLAAWLESDPDGGWSWVVYDQALGRRVATFEERRSPDVPGIVVALDQRHLYVRKHGGYVSIGVHDGNELVLDPEVRDAQLLSVEDLVFAWADPGDDDGSSEYTLHSSETQPVRIADVQGFLASFSPDARWIVFDADEARVFDARTGEQVEIDVDGRVFAAGYDWLDEDSLAVIASRGETGPAELLVCQVPDGTCDQVVADLGTFDGLVESGFALPTGESIDD